MLNVYKVQHPTADEKTGAVDRANCKLYSMHQAHIEFAVVSYNTLLNAQCRAQEGDPAEAQRVLQEMQQAPIQPNEVPSNSLLGVHDQKVLAWA